MPKWRWNQKRGEHITPVCVKVFLSQEEYAKAQKHASEMSEPGRKWTVKDVMHSAWSQGWQIQLEQIGEHDATEETESDWNVALAAGATDGGGPS